MRDEGGGGRDLVGWKVTIAKCLHLEIRRLHPPLPTPHPGRVVLSVLVKMASSPRGSGAYSNTFNRWCFL